MMLENLMVIVFLVGDIVSSVEVDLLLVDLQIILQLMQEKVDLYLL
jgi:hypothetical protein